jgi:long-chain alkane monooxygenase
MSRPLRFCAFVMNTPSHMTHGLWRDPAGDQLRFNDLDFWIETAVALEQGGFDALFFADVVGLHGDYRGGTDLHIELGLQVPVNDPMVIVSALAARTERLGLAFTAGPLQQPPFNFARQVSTLDHATKGRIAWNVVTSLSENAWRNFSNDGLLEHDARYQIAEEYLDVVYKLWQGSWDDGAVHADRASGIYADPAKVHKINHVSEHYRVEGPHLVAPSPQRVPVIFQAGSSPIGRAFAARHAEGQFILSGSPESAAKLVSETRDLAESYGRSRGDIKFFQGMSFVIGSTEAEARQREEELEASMDIDGMIAHFGSNLGVDLGSYEPDTPITMLHTERVQSALERLKETAGDREPTLSDAAQMLGRNLRVVGTPEQIAGRLQVWRDAGVDGINVINATIPGSFIEFSEQVMPVLRRRGLAREELPTGTLRHQLFGTDVPAESHPAARYRGAFRGRSMERVA